MTEGIMRLSITHRARDMAASFIKVTFSLALLLGMAPFANATNKLIDVKYHAVVDHQLELQLVFEQPIEEPEIDLNADPAQIILGFADSISGLEKQTLPIDTVDVETVSTVQNGANLQVFVGLEDVKAYQGRIVGNTYRLTINDEVINSNAGGNNPFVNGIESIDFKRTANGGGQLLVKLDNSTVAANVEQVGSKLELKLYNTDIRSDLLYVMDVHDFATPVNSFETFKEDLTSRFLIDIEGSYEYDYQQDGRVFILSMEMAERLDIAKEEKTYDGRSLSLNFQNMAVRTVLQIIADYNNFNLVVSDTVEGDIT